VFLFLGEKTMALQLEDIGVPLLSHSPFFIPTFSKGYKIRFLTHIPEVMESWVRCNSKSKDGLCSLIDAVKETFPRGKLEIWFWDYSPTPEIYLQTDTIDGVFQCIAGEGWDSTLFKDHLLVIWTVDMHFDKETGYKMIRIFAEERGVLHPNLNDPLSLPYLF